MHLKSSLAQFSFSRFQRRGKQRLIHPGQICRLIFCLFFFQNVSLVFSSTSTFHLCISPVYFTVIGQLGILFGSIFLLFSYESSRGPHLYQPGEIPGPHLLMIALRTTVINLLELMSSHISLIKECSLTFGEIKAVVNNL